MFEIVPHPRSRGELAAEAHRRGVPGDCRLPYLKALKRQLQAAEPRAKQKPARQRRGRSRDAWPGIVSSGLCGAPGVLPLTWPRAP